jgi:hypothetical protein
VLRRSEQTRFLSASDDEVGGLHGAIRAERAQASGAIKVWKGSHHYLCYAMACSRPVRRRSRAASSSINPSRLSDRAPRRAEEE